MAAADFEKAKAFLQAKSGESSLYDHLTEVLLKVVTEQPDNALGLFEHISALTKNSVLAAPSDVKPKSVEDKEMDEAKVTAAATALSLFKPAEPADGVDPQPVQDFTDESSYLEWAGVSLGREESFRVHLSLKYLAAQQSVKDLRLWGKVLGTQGDYIVAEGIMEAEDEEEDALDRYGNTIEKTGEGVNKYTYFACSSPGGAWTRLPNATPAQIAIARQIRRFFTGNLDAPVGGHPPFPGTEAGYLRATIARITAECVVSPAGVFTQPEDDEGGFTIERNEEEFDAPDLSQLDSWVHHVLPINKLGRCTPNPPKTDEEGEPIEDPDAPEPPAVLAPIAGDGDEENPVWGLRLCPVTGQGEEPDENCIVVAKNSQWPGAVAVGFGKRFVNAYVGYGVPYAAKAYAPPIPGNVMSEYKQEEEEAETAPFRQQADVIEDPAAGKAEGEGEEEEEEDE